MAKICFYKYFKLNRKRHKMNDTRRRKQEKFLIHQPKGSEGRR